MEKKHKKTADDATAEAQTPAPDVLPATVELTPAQIETLKEQAAKSEENWDRFVRQTADFENYKKRAARERQEAVTYANEAILQKLIPTLDAFEMALGAIKVDPATEPIRAGILMVSAQLKSTLAEVGLEEIDATGKVFDPNSHEAVSQKETTDAPDGHVVQQIRKGYKFRNRLIRPAGVVVAKKPGS